MEHVCVFIRFDTFFKVENVFHTAHKRAVVHFDNKIISDLLANGNLMLMSRSSLQNP